MITKDMTIGEVIRKMPTAAEVLMSFGMGCVCLLYTSDAADEFRTV